MNFKTSDGKIVSIRKSVKKALTEMPVGFKFHGNELKDICVRDNPELASAYIETFIKSMRYLRHEHGFNIICIDKPTSLYIKGETK